MTKSKLAAQRKMAVSGMALIKTSRKDVNSTPLMQMENCRLAARLQKLASVRSVEPSAKSATLKGLSALPATPLKTSPYTIDRLERMLCSRPCTWSLSHRRKHIVNAQTWG